MDSDKDPWQQVYNVIVKGHSDIGVRFDQIDGRLNGIDGRFDQIDGRLNGIDDRLDEIDGRLNGIDDRLDGIERAADTRHDEYMGQFEDLRHRVADRLVSKEASTKPPPPKRGRAS